MGAAKVATLEVPGASLHYEVRGSGPALLIIPGMPADAGFCAAVAGQLAGTWTVVAYDPRGMSRSRLHGPPEDQQVEVHADDAYRVLAAVGQGPAHSDGLGPALQQFAAEVGLEGEAPQGDPDPEVAASMARMGGNMDLWLSHVIRPSFLRYTPDIARLRAGPSRVVAVIGEASRPHQLAYQTTYALAGRLGTRPVAVPGDHNAVTSRPGEFTAALRRLLDGGP